MDRFCIPHRGLDYPERPCLFASSTAIDGSTTIVRDHVAVTEMVLRQLCVHGGRRGCATRRWLLHPSAVTTEAIYYYGGGKPHRPNPAKSRIYHGRPVATAIAASRRRASLQSTAAVRPSMAAGGFPSFFFHLFSLPSTEVASLSLFFSSSCCWLCDFGVSHFSHMSVQGGGLAPGGSLIAIGQFRRQFCGVGRL